VPAGVVAKRALVSGAVASLVSTLVVSSLGRRRSGAASAATNATSQWVWGDDARRRYAPSLRYTALGYAIHHASSTFWACLFEHATRREQRPSRIVTAAAATAAVAYVVDYHCVPRRLTPGFDSHLPAGAMFATYAAFGAGLAAAAITARSFAGSATRVHAGTPTPRGTRAPPATRTAARPAPALPAR
jgi:hypothetical protein